MNLLAHLRNLTLAAGIVSLAACAGAPRANVTATKANNATPPMVQFQQVRNATIRLQYAGTTFLIDPMLAKKAAYHGFEGTYSSELRYPLVDLPMPVSEVVAADAVILTHLHADHWDDAAKAQLPKNMPIFVQNDDDARSVREDGFADVRVLNEDTEFEGTRLIRTAGQHGSDAMMQSPLGALLGKVSGVVFQRPGYKRVYVAGDTVWNPHVESALQRHQPDVVVLNAGYARVVGFEGSIIMGKEDVERAYRFAPQATVIASHLEAVNHGMLTRKELRAFIAEKGLDPERARVPEDGERYHF